MGKNDEFHVTSKFQQYDSINMPISHNQLKDLNEFVFDNQPRYKESTKHDSYFKDNSYSQGNTLRWFIMCGWWCGREGNTKMCIRKKL